MTDSNYIFEVSTPLGISVRCTLAYWEFIQNQKHPAVFGKLEEVKLTLSEPDEIRKSKKDPKVFLFYRGQNPRWMTAVIKREDGFGFLITAYPTDSIKAGELVWKK
ncbi:MAG: DUF4258 domain-containing protein [Proteobacteria bacterium]|nr:DUF4258 domain-containing protein [Pseudomonadota bacterium]